MDYMQNFSNPANRGDRVLLRNVQCELQDNACIIMEALINSVRSHDLYVMARLCKTQQKGAKQWIG